MRLISISDVANTTHDDAVFRTSSMADLIAFSIFFILLLSCFVHFIWNLIEGSINAAWLFGYFWFGGTFFLFTWLAWTRIKASRLISNWLVKANATRVLIKFRSFQNYYYPESDTVVIDLSWREVDWIRKTKETATKPGSDGTVTQFFTYLDMKLALSEQELKGIESALANERNIKPLRSDLGKLKHELFQARKNKLPKHEIDEIKQRIKLEKMTKRGESKSGAKYHDYPVKLVNGNILRVRWNAIKPNIKKAIINFSKFTQVEEQIKIKTDSSGKLEGKALDDMILDRISKGDIMDANNLAKQHYGYSTTEAKKFIDDLMNSNV
jgi:hypothetical protein